MNRKLWDREREARKRGKHLAAMTPEERQRYEEWKRTHKPGPTGPRAAERARRERSRALREEWQNRPEEPSAPTPEAQALADAINRLQKRLERLLRPAVAETDTGDIFG